MCYHPVELKSVESYREQKESNLVLKKQNIVALTMQEIKQWNRRRDGILKCPSST